MKKVQFLSLFIFSHLFFIKAQIHFNQKILSKNYLEPEYCLKTTLKPKKINVLMNFEKKIYMPTDKSIWKNYRYVPEKLRVEISGNLTNSFAYYFLKNFEKKEEKIKYSFAPVRANFMSNLLKDLDIAVNNYKINNKLTIVVGKQPMAAHYPYFDIFRHLNIIYLGINFIFTPIKSQQLEFQILNNATSDFISMYYFTEERKKENTGQMKYYPDDDFEVKNPLGYTFIWDNFSSMRNMHIRFSYSIFPEIKKRFWQTVTLGGQFNFPSLSLILNTDYVHSKEDLDLQLYGTQAIRKFSESLNAIGNNSSYDFYILKIKYQLTPKWSTFLKIVYETGYIKNVFSNVLNKNFRRCYNCICSLEFLPFKDIDNVKVYFSFEGKKSSYLERLLFLEKSVSVFSLGLIYQFKIL